MAEGIGAHDHRSIIRMLSALSQEGYILYVAGKHRSTLLTTKATELLRLDSSLFLPGDQSHSAMSNSVDLTKEVSVNLPVRSAGSNFIQDTSTPPALLNETYIDSAISFGATGSTYIPSEKLQSIAAQVSSVNNFASEDPTSPSSWLRILRDLNPSTAEWVMVLTASGLVAKLDFASSVIAFGVGFLLVLLAVLVMKGNRK